MNVGGVQGAALQAFDQVMIISADCARKSPCSPELLAELKSALEQISPETITDQMSEAERAVYTASAALVEHPAMSDAVRALDYSRRVVIRANADSKKLLSAQKRHAWQDRKDLE